jgi:hypothetical protein
MDDRSGDQVREIRDEQRIVQEIELGGLAFVNVDQERDLREGEERYAERQEDVGER